MKRKKTWLIVIVCVLLVVLLSAIGLYVYFSPLLKLKAKMDDVVSETYHYSVECTVDGPGLDFLDGKLQGTIEGTKGEEVLQGELSVLDMGCLGFYANVDGEVIFDLGPLCQSLLDKVNIKGAFLLKGLVKEVNLSLDQIETIIGKEIISLSDAGVSFELFDTISGNTKGRDSISVEVLKVVKEKDKLLGDDALYFSVFLSEDVDVILGIPEDKDDLRLSLDVSYKETDWEFVGEYEPEEVEEQKMPKKTVSDDVIELLRKLYTGFIEQK